MERVGSAHRRGSGHRRSAADRGARQDGRAFESPLLCEESGTRRKRSSGSLKARIAAVRAPLGTTRPANHSPRAAGVTAPQERNRMAQERIVGIDLGTTNSLVAYMEGETPVVIPGEDGANLVPSVVALREDGRMVVGNGARTHL